MKSLRQNTEFFIWKAGKQEKEPKNTGRLLFSTLKPSLAFLIFPAFLLFRFNLILYNMGRQNNCKNPQSMI